MSTMNRQVYETDRVPTAEELRGRIREGERLLCRIAERADPDVQWLRRVLETDLENKRRLLAEIRQP